MTNSNNNTKIKTHTIIVLPDGETWNTVEGCSIVVIDETQFHALCEDRIDARDLSPIAEVSLVDNTRTV